MVGVVLVGHGGLAEEMMRTAEFIAGKLERVAAVRVNQEEPLEALQKKIRDAIRQVAGAEGVLVLTDMFGGTPSNLSLSFMEPGKVEVISGMNLPMVLKLIENREGLNLQAYAREIRESGQRNISLASEILDRGQKK
ncbi:MAG: PTS sugar transporter subunit IIA [Proteobacteria bacterium]|nr:PTS sugar transporter subunit IIA [Pseudomonadota bacterium]